MSNINIEGYKKIAQNVLLQAVKDFEGKNKHAIKEFVKSEWFNVLAEISGINPDNARQKIISEKT